MGTLHYDGSKFSLDDRVLAHLQVIIAMKLRRNEGFFISWGVTGPTGAGQHSIWIDNGVPIQVELQSSPPPPIDREWADSLAQSANTNHGLIITDESIEPA